MLKEVMPKCVGKYDDNNSVMPVVVDSYGSRTERRLFNWFKCTKFEKKCFATRQTPEEFKHHLFAAHPNDELFCIYCERLRNEVIVVFFQLLLIF